MIQGYLKGNWGGDLRKSKERSSRVLSRTGSQLSISKQVSPPAPMPDPVASMLSTLVFGPVNRQFHRFLPTAVYFDKGANFFKCEVFWRALSKSYYEWTRCIFWSWIRYVEIILGCRQSECTINLILCITQFPISKEEGLISEKSENRKWFY